MTGCFLGIRGRNGGPRQEKLQSLKIPFRGPPFLPLFFHHALVIPNEMIPRIRGISEMRDPTLQADSYSLGPYFLYHPYNTGRFLTLQDLRRLRTSEMRDLPLQAGICQSSLLSAADSINVLKAVP